MTNRQVDCHFSSSAVDTFELERNLDQAERKFNGVKVNRKGQNVHAQIFASRSLVILEFSPDSGYLNCRHYVQ